jgi:hypothetical protein
MYDADTARQLGEQRGFSIARDGKGWRRDRSGCSRPVQCVAWWIGASSLSPAGGGGGMPVVLDPAGRPRGIEAVVDKDLAAVILASTVKAERLLLLTDLDGVYDGFGTQTAHRLDTLSPAEARMLARERGAWTREHAAQSRGGGALCRARWHRRDRGARRCSRGARGTRRHDRCGLAHAGARLRPRRARKTRTPRSAAPPMPRRAQAAMLVRTVLNEGEMS